MPDRIRITYIEDIDLLTFLVRYDLSVSVAPHKGIYYARIEDYDVESTGPSPKEALHELCLVVSGRDVIYESEHPWRAPLDATSIDVSKLRITYRGGDA